MQAKVDGVSTAAVQLSGVPAEMVYPAEQDGGHDEPEARVVPPPHAAEFITVGRLQGFGLHENVAGARVPVVHTRGTTEDGV